METENVIIDCRAWKTEILSRCGALNIMCDDENAAFSVDQLLAATATNAAEHSILVSDCNNLLKNIAHQIVALLRCDEFAMSFQTMGQYRSAVIEQVSRQYV